ncbi:MAG TPA: response regulator transcription factor, partial [Crocinitomicaceae bacterium]|nr:response regulator transcription factor [Crocinitomicaceae bacterium]
MIKVFIIDDHQMVIEGLKLLLQNQEGIEVVGTANSGQEGIDALAKQKADIILLDINMPEMNGIDTCKKLLKEQPKLKIIAVSMHKEGSLIKLILSNGAKGYVLKNAGQDEVVEAIHTVYKGKMYLDDTVNEIVINSVANTHKKSLVPFPTLSRREKDVLKC